MSIALKLESVTMAFGGILAVVNVSLSLQAGERHAVLGPNGAGKTTLFNVLSGIYKPSAGRILLFDEDVSGLSIHRRAARGLGRTFQITSLFQSLTVFENILLASQGRERYRFNFCRSLSRYPKLLSRVDKMLDQWDLTDKRDVVVSSLSYGDQRQLEVIMALASNPRILLLDEPTAGLSSSETASMTRFLKTLDSSVALLIIEHDMEVVFSLAEKITVMNFGNVVAQGWADEVKSDPQVMEIYLGGGGACDAES